MITFRTILEQITAVEAEIFKAAETAAKLQWVIDRGGLKGEARRIAKGQLKEIDRRIARAKNEIRCLEGREVARPVRYTVTAANMPVVSPSVNFKQIEAVS